MRFRVAFLGFSCLLATEVWAAEKTAREVYDQLSALRVDPERKMAAGAQMRYVVVQPAACEGPERHRVESRGLAVLEFRLLTKAFEPVAKDSGRAAIVFIVADHRRPGILRNRGRVFEELDVGLKNRKRRICVGERGVPVEAIKGLEAFDGVAFDAGANSMPHNLVQIDKQLRTEHPVEFFLARRVPSHQTLEGSRLVGRIVVDVHAGKFGPARYDEVDKILDARTWRRQKQYPSECT